MVCWLPACPPLVTAIIEMPDGGLLHVVEGSPGDSGDEDGDSMDSGSESGSDDGMPGGPWDT